MPALLYTLAFCRSNGKMLMVHRLKPPHQFLWNGLGGKIEPGEHPDAAVRREIFEEADIDVQAFPLTYLGIVTWSDHEDVTDEAKGMHCYVIDLPESLICKEPRTTPEGTIAWKDEAWVCDVTNPDVATSLRLFLPQMLAASEPMHRHLLIRDGVILGGKEIRKYH